MTDDNPETETPEISGTDGGAAPGGVNWRDSLSGEYRQVADKFTSPADVVQSYAQLERKLGGAVNR